MDNQMLNETITNLELLKEEACIRHCNVCNYHDENNECMFDRMIDNFENKNQLESI